MTLDDAISHAEDVASGGACGDCRVEHELLVKWLRELRVLRAEVDRLRHERAPTHRCQLGKP